jgi:hypothetical protein
VIVNLQSCPHCGTRGHVGQDGLCPACRKPIVGGVVPVPAVGPSPAASPTDAFAAPAEPGASPGTFPTQYLGGGLGAVIASLVTSVWREGGLNLMVLVQVGASALAVGLVFGGIWAYRSRR